MHSSNPGKNREVKLPGEAESELKFSLRAKRTGDRARGGRTDTAIRQGKVGVVERVKGLCPELQCKPLDGVKFLHQTEVPVLIAGANDDVSAGVPKGVERRGNETGRVIEPLDGLLRSGQVAIAYPVGPLQGSRVRGCGRHIQRERGAGLKGKNTRELPSSGYAIHQPAGVRQEVPTPAYRKLVDTTQRKAVFEVEVGQAVICLKIIWVLDVEPRLSGGRIAARSFIKALAIGIRA